MIRDVPEKIELLAERYELEPIDVLDAQPLTRVIGFREPGS